MHWSRSRYCIYNCSIFRVFSLLQIILEQRKASEIYRKYWQNYSYYFLPGGSGTSFGPQDTWNKDICPYATFQVPSAESQQSVQQINPQQHTV